MSESSQSINRFRHRVALRKRLLSLQDHIAVSVLIGGALSAGSILFIKMGTLQARSWSVVAAVMGAAIAIAVARWILTRSKEADAAFDIDRELGLEDRVATSFSIIQRGGPHRAVEEALLEDTAGRIKDIVAPSVVPYRFPRWYAFSLLGVVALLVALVMPQKALPGGESLAAERADIESAGEQLEQSAKEVEQFVPPETVTASLAVEQAELGRALKRSPDSRAEALKKLSEIEGRIRQRHEELAGTRADDIVSLAEKRLNAAIASKPKKSEIETERGSGGQPEATAQTGNPAPQTPERKGDSGPQPEGAQATARNPYKKSPDAGEPAEVKPKDAKSISSAERNQENEPGSSSARPPEKGAGEVGQPPNRSEQGGKTAEPSLPQSEKAPTASTPSPAPQAGAAEQPQAENKREPEGDPEGNKESTGPLSNMIADQAARAVPRLSEELLKKAGQLKAGELKPEDIQRLAKAAEMLARDLAPIAQSKEFQQSLQQLARQVDPEQLEQVARQLMSQEKLRQELEAAARLLMQNRQAREIAAGLARQFDQMQPPRPAPDGGQTARQRNGQGDGQQAGGQGSSRGQAERLEAENRTSGLGKEQKLGGKLQKKDGGEYLFLQSRPDAGASRVPYSSAYPRYRREAERSVERSRIPPNMRKVVRGYFDAINPDSGKKQ